MKRDIKKSMDLKRALAHVMFWNLHYSVVVDEFNFMDIFGVRRNGYAVEFEIKVTKSDFMREINLIRGIQPVARWGKDWAKWKKHAMYLGKEVKEPPSIYDKIPGWDPHHPSYFVPNEFNFYVPDYLTTFALEKLQGLPYGLYQWGKKEVLHSDGSSHSYHSNYEAIKKPTKLHTEKRCEGIMEDLAHALTVRSRLLN